MTECAYWKKSGTERVYDLLNTGPKHRFTILTDHGPVIIHNCVQAIGRDVLALGMLRADNDGFDIVMHVHDEIITEAPIDDTYHTVERLIEHMSAPISWAPGLPLGAAGWEGLWYRKD